MLGSLNIELALSANAIDLQVFIFRKTFVKKK